MVARLNIKMGLTSVKKPAFATEPDFVAQVNKQMVVLRETLEDIFQQFEDATPDMMIEALTPTLELAKKYTPKQTGALVNSAYLENVGFRGQPRVEMGFAKGGVPRYAAQVHERVEQQHRAPTRAKFMEAAVNEDFANILPRLQESYRRFMGV